MVKLRGRATQLYSHANRAAVACDSFKKLDDGGLTLALEHKRMVGIALDRFQEMHRVKPENCGAIIGVAIV